MRYLLAVLLSFSAAVCAQPDPGPAHYDGLAEPFGHAHARQKQRELVASGLRVQASLRMANERKEAQYAENRHRCQTALRAATTCGRVATFSCDSKGFKPIVDAAARSVPLDDSARTQGRCALEAAARLP